MIFTKTTGRFERCDYHQTILLRSYHSAPIAKAIKAHVVDAIPSAVMFLPDMIPTLWSGIVPSLWSSSGVGAGVGLYVASAPTVAFSVVQAIGLYPERVVRKGQRVIVELIAVR